MAINPLDNIYLRILLQVQPNEAAGAPLIEGMKVTCTAENLAKLKIS